MSIKDELLSKGIKAFESGDMAAATAAFSLLVRQLPEDDEGWLWLGKVIGPAERKEFCFQRAIQLNPANTEAGRLLVQLSRPASPAPRAESLVPAAKAEELLGPLPAPPASPFLPEEPLTKANPFVQTPVPEQAPPVQAEPPSPSQTEQKKKKRKWLWLVGLAIGIVLCGLAVVFLLSSGVLSNLTGLLPFQPLPTQAQFPTATTGMVPSPTATPSATVSTQASPTPSLVAMLPTVAYTPSYQDTPCEFDEPDGVTVECGNLLVPEDRTDPESAIIELAVAVFRSTSANPAPDPVLFLQGGPGGEAVMLSSNAYPILVQPFLGTRDFIAIDQRGTGLSDPALGCEELTSVYKQDIQGQLPASSRGFIYDNAFRSCHGMMSIGGIDLNAYTTYDSAADIKDLAGMLGYAQINLYGASYGSRLAQVVMREYPGLVRSAILDSVVPIDVALYNTDQLRFGSALDQLFATCQAEPGCNEAYPDLANAFWETVASLNEAPVSVTAPLLTGGEITEDLDGSDLIGVTLAMLKQTDLIPSVPQAIYRIRSGDYSTFVAAQSSLPFAFEGIDLGLYISVMCHEQVMVTTVTELQAALDAQMDLGLYSRLPFLGDAQDIFETCQVWGAERPRVGENDPLTSDIPTLVIEGAFDPATPPLFGQRILPGLSNSTYVEFPNQGHVPTAMDESGCAMGIVQDFLAAPQQTPDISCVDDAREIGYILPYTGTPAITLVEFDENGVVAKRPADWAEQGDGIFLRNNSPLDITQIAILRTSFSSEELLDSLSSKLYGYQGFDAAPVQTGTRQKNGLTWTLYQTSSYGRPVELAMADDGDTSIIILLFCYEDEQEALVQTAYLPMIDSVIP